MKEITTLFGRPVVENSELEPMEIVLTSGVREVIALEVRVDVERAVIVVRAADGV